MHTVRLSEAAEIMNIPFKKLRGWSERGLIKTVGRDVTKPGHPHLIELKEVNVLARTIDVQQFLQDTMGIKVNPGPLIKHFRDKFEGRKLHV